MTCDNEGRPATGAGKTGADMVRKKFKKPQWRRLSAVDIAWLHFKVALAVMLFIPMLSGPTMQKHSTFPFLVAWVITCVLGILVSVIGLLMGAQRDMTRKVGVRIELVGICLLLAGPACYLLIQLGLLMTVGPGNVSDGKGSWLGLMFCYVICTALIARGTMVWYSAATSKMIYRYVEEKKPPERGEHVG